MNEPKKEYSKAIDYICGQIKSGKITVGDRIPTERTLAAELEISRNSTREALRSLENMGIISSKRGSGSYYTGDVSKQLSQTIRTLIEIKLVTKKDICSFRRITEKALCFQIIENSQENFAFEDIDLLQNDDIEKMIEADRRFHYQIIEKANNRFWLSIMNAVTDVYRSWIDDVLRNCSEKMQKNLYLAHMKMQEALLNRDKAACESAIDAHYDLIDEVLDLKENH